MGKYTKYTSNYPTKYSSWMYPPKNIGLMKYISLTMSGLWKAQGANLKSWWTYGLVLVPVTYAMFVISKKGKGSKFSQSIRDPKGNWLYGPPSEKMLHEHHEHEILHAPDK